MMKGNRLAILVFLLCMPSNLDEMGLFEGVFDQIFDNVLLLIVEDEVVGNESLDDCFTRWTRMMIYFIMSVLGIFAQAGSNERPRATMSKRRSLTKSLHLLAVAIQRNLAKISLSSGARCLVISSSHNILFRRIAVILFGLDKLAGGLKLLSLKRLLATLVYPCTIADQRTCLLL
jgi:hypothetical protein